MTTKLEALRLLEQDRTMLLLDRPFLAVLAMHLDIIPVEDFRCKTMSTDGARVFVNPEFVGSRTPADRLFILAHEVWHCALQHILRGQGRQERGVYLDQNGETKTVDLWNLAIDHEVNSLLVEDGLVLPADAVHFGDCTGLSAEEVYERLVKNLLPPRGWPDTAGVHDWDDVVPEDADVDPDFSPLVLPDVLRGWPERVVAAAQQIERRHGTVPAGLARIVAGLRKPVIPWQELLRQYVTADIGDERSWYPCSRRYVHQGLYLPSRRGFRLEVTVAVDTSGSTSAYLPIFAAELWSLLTSFGQFRVRYLECDAYVHTDVVLDQDNPPPRGDFEFQGGGGTSFVPVFNRLAESEEPTKLLIFLTDGFGDAPEQAPLYPTLWVLCPGGVQPATWGTALRLPEVPQ